MTLVPSLTRATPLRVTRPAPGRVLLAIVALHTVLLGVFFHPFFRQVVSLPLQVATGGMVSHTLTASLIEVGLIFVGVGMLWGGMRLADMGIRGVGIVNAVAATMALWGLTQLIMAGLNALHPEPPVLNPAWMSWHRAEILGATLPALLGAAFVEEVTYRGILLPHLFHQAARWGIRGTGWQLLVALVLSQVFFGLNHIPVGLAGGMNTPDLVLYVVQAALVGVFFSVLYLRTNNLWLVTGVHAVLNQPYAFHLSPVDPAFVVLVLGLVLMLVAPFFDAVFRRDALVAPRPRTST